MSRKHPANGRDSIGGFLMGQVRRVPDVAVVWLAVGSRGFTTEDAGVTERLQREQEKKSYLLSAELLSGLLCPRDTQFLLTLLSASLPLPLCAL